MRFPGLEAWAFALKTYAAAILALYVALAADLGRPGWAVTTVFIVSQPFASATRSKAAYRTMGTLLGAACSVILVPNLVQAPELLCLALAAWVAVCLYLSLQDRGPRSYIFMLAGYSVAFIGFPGVNAPLSIFDTSVTRVEEITLGVVCSSIVHSVVLPKSVANAIFSRVEDWIEEARHLSASLLGYISSADAAGGVRRPFVIAGRAIELDALASHLQYDASPLRDEVPRLQLLQNDLERLLPILVSIGDRIAIFSQGNIPIRQGILTFDRKVRDWLVRRPDALTAHALRAELETLEAGLKYEGRWDSVLCAGLLARYRELIHVIQSCGVHQRHLKDPLTVPMRVSRTRRPAVRKHVDQGLALLSAVTAFVAILAGCVLWIGSGWVDGASVPMIAAVGCSFFATQDSPLPSMRKFGFFAFVAILISIMYSELLLPAVTTFEMGALVLAPAFICLGLLIANPSTSFIGMVVSTNLATLMGLSNRYTSDFAGTVNSGIALMVGIVLTSIIMSVLRARSSQWSVRRILRAAREDTVRAVAGTSRKSYSRIAREAFVRRMMDRFHLVWPRIAHVPQEHADGDTLFDDLRIGTNAIDLRRLGARLPKPLSAEIGELLQGIARMLGPRTGERLAEESALRQKLDSVLAKLSMTHDPSHFKALMAMASIRIVLFRKEPPPARM